MRSRTLDKIDTAVAWVEGTEDRVTHWLRCHFSWAYRKHAYEETFTFTIAVTGKLRERARALAVSRIRARLMKDGATGPFVTGDGTAYQIGENERDCPDWLAALRSTGVVRTPPINHGAAQAKHRSQRSR